MEWGVPRNWRTLGAPVDVWAKGQTQTAAACAFRKNSAMLKLPARPSGRILGLQGFNEIVYITDVGCGRQNTDMKTQSS